MNRVTQECVKMIPCSWSVSFWKHESVRCVYGDNVSSVIMEYKDIHWKKEESLWMHNLGVGLYPGLLKTHTFKVKSMGSVYTWVRFIPEYIRYVKETLYSCLQDQFVQEWTGIVDAGRKCTLYKHIKTDFKLEPYLLRLSCDTYRYIVKLRCSNHKLAIETGRYSGIDRNLRYCDLCASDILGDEYHTFFECTKPEIVSLRKRFIPRHYSQQPSMFKFVKLLRSVDDIKVGSRISSFIRHSKIV